MAFNHPHLMELRCWVTIARAVIRSGVSKAARIRSSSRAGSSRRVATVRQAAVACSTSSTISIARVLDRRYICAVCRARSMLAVGSPSVSMVGGWDVCRHVSEDVPGMADGRARLAARVRRRPGLAREVGIMAAVTVRSLDDQVKESRRVKTAD